MPIGYRSPVADRSAPAGRLPRAGDLVVAAGAGVTGLPVIRFLAGTGASVLDPVVVKGPGNQQGRASPGQPTSTIPLVDTRTA